MPKVNLGEQAIPLPPFDYIKKDIDVIRVMEDRLTGHLYRGLSAVNMQFLAQTPLSISGDAKAVDRDELNNFVYNVAEDLVYIADYLYGIIADYRYAYQYPVLRERRRMLPYIPVPEHYEIVGPDDTLDTITQMRAGGIGGSLLAAMLRDFAKRQFADEKDVSIPLLLEMELDPFSGATEAERDAMLATGCIRRQDYIRSVYIKDFVRRALGEKAGFADMPYEQQVAVIDAYAEEILVETQNIASPADKTQNNQTQNVMDKTQNIASPADKTQNNQTQNVMDKTQNIASLQADGGIPSPIPVVDPDSVV